MGAGGLTPTRVPESSCRVSPSLATGFDAQVGSPSQAPAFWGWGHNDRGAGIPLQAPKQSLRARKPPVVWTVPWDQDAPA